MAADADYQASGNMTPNGPDRQSWRDLPAVLRDTAKRGNFAPSCENTGTITAALAPAYGFAGRMTTLAARREAWPL
jgi:hypothetical protein